MARRSNTPDRETTDGRSWRLRSRRLTSGTRRAIGSALACAAWVALAACGGGAAESGRYPEQKRPDAPRSASDGEVLGASQQNPADTLEASLTNQHGAAHSPHAEEPADAAHERLEYERCLEQNKPGAATPGAATPGAAAPAAAGGTTPAARRRPVCEPPSERAP
jgi:hypothetical protein